MSWEIALTIIGVILGILGIIGYACNALKFIVIEPFQKSIGALCKATAELRDLLRQLTENMALENRKLECRIVALEEQLAAIRHTQEDSHGD